MITPTRIIQMILAPTVLFQIGHASKATSLIVSLGHCTSPGFERFGDLPERDGIRQL